VMGRPPIPIDRISFVFQFCLPDIGQIMIYLDEYLDFLADLYVQENFRKLISLFYAFSI